MEKGTIDRCGSLATGRNLSRCSGIFDLDGSSAFQSGQVAFQESCDIRRTSL